MCCLNRLQVSPKRHNFRANLGCQSKPMRQNSNRWGAHSATTWPAQRIAHWPLSSRGEPGRGTSQIELIATENMVSQAGLDAQCSLLTNKYAEGDPGRRCYGGCEFVGVAARLAIERAKQLFGCGFANVQPHAGAQANQAVFLALLKPGDTILGMSLAAGGHLTHGAPPNLSGKWFHAVSYGVRA